MTISSTTGIPLLLVSVMLLGCHHLRPEAEPEWPATASTPAAGPYYAPYGAAPWPDRRAPAGTYYGAAGAYYGPPGPGHAAPPGPGSAAPPRWAPAAATNPGPPPADGSAARAAAFAQRQLGKPYCYGGTGPDCYDCSGLTYAAWRWAGKPVPRTSSEQHDELTTVPWTAAQVGDVVWRPGHVGLYVGDGWVIHAPETGKRVEYEPARKYRQIVRP